MTIHGMTAQERVFLAEVLENLGELLISNSDADLVEAEMIWAIFQIVLNSEVSVDRRIVAWRLLQDLSL